MVHLLTVKKLAPGWLFKWLYLCRGTSAVDTHIRRDVRGADTDSMPRNAYLGIQTHVCLQTAFLGSVLGNHGGFSYHNMLKLRFWLSRTAVGLHFNKLSGDVGLGSKISEDSALSQTEGGHPGGICLESRHCGQNQCCTGSNILKNIIPIPGENDWLLESLLSALTVSIIINYYN